MPSFLASSSTRPAPTTTDPVYLLRQGQHGHRIGTYAIMEKGRMKAGGLLGKLGWAFIHVLYLGRAEGQLMFILQGLYGVLLGRTGSRYIDTPSVTPEVAAPEKSGEMRV
jgi:hypothetical protein